MDALEAEVLGSVVQMDKDAERAVWAEHCQELAVEGLEPHQHKIYDRRGRVVSGWTDGHPGPFRRERRMTAKDCEDPECPDRWMK